MQSKSNLEPTTAPAITTDIRHPSGLQGGELPWKYSFKSWKPSWGKRRKEARISDSNISKKTDDPKKKKKQAIMKKLQSTGGSFVYRVKPWLKEKLKSHSKSKSLSEFEEVENAHTAYISLAEDTKFISKTPGMSSTNEIHVPTNTSNVKPEAKHGRESSTNEKIPYEHLTNISSNQRVPHPISTNEKSGDTQHGIDLQVMQIISEQDISAPVQGPGLPSSNNTLPDNDINILVASDSEVNESTIEEDDIDHLLTEKDLLVVDRGGDTMVLLETDMVTDNGTDPESPVYATVSPKMRDNSKVLLDMEHLEPLFKLDITVDKDRLQMVTDNDILNLTTASSPEETETDTGSIHIQDTGSTHIQIPGNASSRTDHQPDKSTEPIPERTTPTQSSRITQLPLAQLAGKEMADSQETEPEEPLWEHNSRQYPGHNPDSDPVFTANAKSRESTSGNSDDLVELESITTPVSTEPSDPERDSDSRDETEGENETPASDNITHLPPQTASVLVLNGTSTEDMLLESSVGLLTTPGKEVATEETPTDVLIHYSTTIGPDAEPARLDKPLHGRLSEDTYPRSHDIHLPGRFPKYGESPPQRYWWQGQPRKDKTVDSTEKSTPNDTKGKWPSKTQLQGKTQRIGYYTDMETIHHGNSEVHAPIGHGNKLRGTTTFPKPQFPEDNVKNEALVDARDDDTVVTTTAASTSTHTPVSHHNWNEKQAAMFARFWELQKQRHEERQQALLEMMTGRENQAEGGAHHGDSETNTEEGGADHGDSETSTEDGGAHHGDSETSTEEKGAHHGDSETNTEDGGAHHGDSSHSTSGANTEEPEDTLSTQTKVQTPQQRSSLLPGSQMVVPRKESDPELNQLQVGTANPEGSQDSWKSQNRHKIAETEAVIASESISLGEDSTLSAKNFRTKGSSFRLPSDKPTEDVPYSSGMSPHHKQEITEESGTKTRGTLETIRADSIKSMMDQTNHNTTQSQSVHTQQNVGHHTGQEHKDSERPIIKGDSQDMEHPFPANGATNRELKQQQLDRWHRKEQEQLEKQQKEQEQLQKQQQQRLRELQRQLLKELQEQRERQRQQQLEIEQRGKGRDGQRTAEDRDRDQGDGINTKKDKLHDRQESGTPTQESSPNKQPNFYQAGQGNPDNQAEDSQPRTEDRIHTDGNDNQAKEGSKVSQNVHEKNWIRKLKQQLRKEVEEQKQRLKGGRKSSGLKHPDQNGVTSAGKDGYVIANVVTDHRSHSGPDQMLYHNQAQLSEKEPGSSWQAVGSQTHGSQDLHHNGKQSSFQDRNRGDNSQTSDQLSETKDAALDVADPDKGSGNSRWKPINNAHQSGSDNNPSTDVQDSHVSNQDYNPVLTPGNRNWEGPHQQVLGGLSPIQESPWNLEAPPPDTATARPGRTTQPTVNREQDRDSRPTSTTAPDNAQSPPSGYLQKPEPKTQSDTQWMPVGGMTSLDRSSAAQDTGESQALPKANFIINRQKDQTRKKKKFFHNRLYKVKFPSSHANATMTGSAANPRSRHNFVKTRERLHPQHKPAGGWLLQHKHHPGNQTGPETARRLPHQALYGFPKEVTAWTSMFLGRNKDDSERHVPPSRAQNSQQAIGGTSNEATKNKYEVYIQSLGKSELTAKKEDSRSQGDPAKVEAGLQEESLLSAEDSGSPSHISNAMEEDGHHRNQLGMNPDDGHHGDQREKIREDGRHGYLPGVDLAADRQVGEMFNQLSVDRALQLASQDRNISSGSLDRGHSGVNAAESRIRSSGESRHYKEHPEKFNLFSERLENEENSRDLWRQSNDNPKQVQQDTEHKAHRNVIQRKHGSDLQSGSGGDKSRLGEDRSHPEENKLNPLQHVLLGSGMVQPPPGHSNAVLDQPGDKAEWVTAFYSERQREQDSRENNLLDTDSYRDRPVPSHSNHYNRPLNPDLYDTGKQMEDSPENKAPSDDVAARGRSNSEQSKESGEKEPRPNNSDLAQDRTSENSVYLSDVRDPNIHKTKVYIERGHPRPDKDQPPRPQDVITPPQPHPAIATVTPAGPPPYNIHIPVGNPPYHGNLPRNGMGSLHPDDYLTLKAHITRSQGLPAPTPLAPLARESNAKGNNRMEGLEMDEGLLAGSTVWGESG